MKEEKFSLFWYMRNQKYKQWQWTEDLGYKRKPTSDIFIKMCSKNDRNYVPKPTLTLLLAYNVTVVIPG